jgi:pilus assembly protein Flp/PilA
MLRKFLAEENGATVVEYGLIVALIFLAIVVGVNQFANSTQNMYNSIVQTVQNSIP